MYIEIRGKKEDVAQTKSEIQQIVTTQTANLEKLEKGKKDTMA